MDARTWQSVKQLLADVVDLPPAEQRAYIERQCVDPALRAELLAMLDSPAPLSNVMAGATVLPPGSRLGPYEILGSIGAGGMGEVYKARDPRLGREVAMKVLPVRASADPHAAARFTHEARAIAALNHPHICAIYDVGEDAGRPYLVMELLDGETLHQRLRRGRLPPPQLLEYGIALTDALIAAHDRGVIHRDLKPSNIALTSRGELKVLDFGLAKRLPVFDVTHSGDEPLTAAGSGVGTLAYMSPEQMRGEEVDARTDIFSLGAVLYEMATGRAAFEGATSGVVADAILNEQPPLVSELRADLPASLAFVVDKALDKNRDRRYQDARSLSTDLARVSREIAPGTEPKRRRVPVLPHARRPRRYGMLAALALVCLIAGIALGWVRFRTPAVVSPPIQFEVLKQSDTALDSFALSPDGRYLAYVDAVADGAPQIYLRAFDNAVSRPLAGTEGAEYPFWAPDSEWIGFFAHEGLRKVSVAGGPSQLICPNRHARGGAWNREGVIVFGDVGGLHRVPAMGGEPKVIVADSRDGLRWPQFLPDGRRILYFDLGTPVGHMGQGLRVVSLDDTQTTEVLKTDFMGRYAPPGYLLYVDDQWNLVARGFDPRSLQLSESVLPVAQWVGVRRHINYKSASFSVSDNGSLVVGNNADIVRLQWIDRSGARGEFVGEPDAYNSLELSPDGRRVALEVLEAHGQADLWMLDLARGDRQSITRTRQAFEYCPRWSPDGLWLAYSWTTRAFEAGVRRKRIDGAGSEEILLEQTEHLKFVRDWSREGTILYSIGESASEKTGTPRPGVVPADKGNSSRVPTLPLPSDQYMSDARYSPDGQWIAYVSNETRREEVYVQRVGGGRLTKASIGGGQFPIWRADGAELFYVAPDGTLVATPITRTRSELTPGIPVNLFRLPFYNVTDQSGSSRTLYSTRDGRRFLVCARLREGPHALTWTLNWVAALPHK